MKLIIFGSPGSGKGTQSTKLEKALNLKHISTGDLLRKEKTVQNTLKAGELVPDECIYELLSHELDDSYILDGFPRNKNQCEMLGDISVAIYIKLNENLCVKRLLERNEGRMDDNKETINHRMEVYKNEIGEIVDFYDKRGKLIVVDGNGPVDDVFNEIMANLNKKQE